MQQSSTPKRPVASHSDTAPEEISNLPHALTIKNNRRVMEGVDEIKPFYRAFSTQDATENHQTEIKISSPKCIEDRNSSFRIQGLSTERTTFILVTIVILFAITHSNRVALKTYMSLKPEYSSLENFTRCLMLGR